MKSLAAFLGQWSLQRRIDDRIAGRQGIFEGRAAIVGTHAVAVYEETGLLTLDGGSFHAQRRYRWESRGDAIAVLFDNGREFHEITEAGDARHWCAPDDYRVRYDFADWPNWRAEWSVRGPRKDYTMISLYAPVK